MKIIRDYLLKELTRPFFLSLGVFTFVLVMGNLIKLADLIINKGVDPINVGKLFLYLIPYMLSYSLPMAILTGTLLALGRLSSDGEITAIRTSGIKITQIAWPFFTIGLIVSLFALLLNDHILPRAHFASRKVVVQVGKKNPAAYLEPGTFIKAFKNHIIFIYDIQQNKMQHIRIYVTEPDRPTRTIIAEQGEFEQLPDKSGIRLKLTNGTSDEPDIDNPGNFYKLNFNTYYINLKFSGNYKNTELSPKPEEMTIGELKNQIALLEKQGIKYNPLSVEVHKRIAFSFAPLVFVIIAFPLGIITHRREKSIGFGLSLLILVMYYIMLVASETMALKEILSPPLISWMPNIITFLIGVYLFRQIEK
jgi:lipopolysaccharide export system permease protein